MKLVYAFLLVSAPFAFVCSANAATKEAKLLAQMKAACGGVAWDRVQSWHERSTAEIKGLPPIENEVWHDMRMLKSAMTSVAGGRVFRKSGYNGVQAWRVGPDAQMKVITGVSDLRRQRRDAYLSSFGWFFPKRFPAKFELLPDMTLDEKTYRVLRITPENAEPLDLWVDSAARLVRRIVAGKEYAELSEYRTFDGVCTATVGRQGTGTPENDIVLRVSNVTTTERAPSSAFDVPKP